MQRPWQSLQSPSLTSLDLCLLQLGGVFVCHVVFRIHMSERLRYAKQSFRPRLSCPLAREPDRPL